MAIQWHPLFVQLLRPWLEGYYEVQTNVSVGDVPRQADLVLLRRTREEALPFQGLWRHLTIWNILEYKGPTVSARLEAIDLLIELGLGIHRRLNEENRKSPREPVTAQDVSFWYLANRLGGRFLRGAKKKLGSLDRVGEGIWRSTVIERSIFLVSSVDLPIEPDCMPFHVLGVESLEKEQAAARLIIQQPSLWDLYSQFMGSLHPETLKELQAMARTSRKGPQFHLKPLTDLMGLKEVLDQLGREQVIGELFTDQKQKKKVIAEMLQYLSDEERADLRRKLE
jgi:hypothetical protein